MSRERRADDDVPIAAAALIGTAILFFVFGALIGVHWYDSKYRPEIDRYLKQCETRQK